MTTKTTSALERLRWIPGKINKARHEPLEFLRGACDTIREETFDIIAAFEDEQRDAETFLALVAFARDDYAAQLRERDERDARLREVLLSMDGLNLADDDRREAALAIIGGAR